VLLRYLAANPSLRIATHYEVGGLNGQSNYAYLLPEWLDQMRAAPDAF
jgi:hypothetical protein